VVDDHPDKLVALEAILAELGQNVVKVGSGKEALRALLHGDFAVILLDVSMPVMDGFETAALIRTRPRCEHTPIIFITAYGDETHVARGYRLGAVDYILTPVVPEVLRAKVSVFVELFRKTEEIRRQAAQLRERAAQLHELTRAALAINAAGSAENILPIVADRARSLFGLRPLARLPREIGRVLRSRWAGWRAGVLVPDRAWQKALGLPAASHALSNGGLRVQLLVIDVPAPPRSG